MTRSLVIALLIGPAAIARADTTIDLAKELRAIAAKVPVKDDTQNGPAAGPGCTATTRGERDDVKKRVFAWIDSKHPGERGATDSTANDSSLAVRFGCKDRSGAVVLDISQDREPAKPGPNAYGTRRNYLLRVSPTAIDVLAEDTSTLSMNWMEWADMGRIALLAQVDLDGDGALDVVYSDHEREGGAISSYDLVQVRYASGNLGKSAMIENLAGVKLVKGRLVLAGQTRNDQLLYVCLGRDLHVAPCAASAPLQRAADRREIVSRYRSIDAGDLPDRDLLAQELSILGVTSKRRAPLIMAARETTPAERAQRRVTAFLVKAGLIEPAPMPELVTQSHAEARTYLDNLATKLGDSPCTKTPLTDAEKTKATAWVRKQDAKADDVVIEASGCGPYVWAAWNPPVGDGKRREVLLGRDGTTRILGFTYQQEMPDPAPGHSESWFVHDGTIVGIAIASGNLWVIANNTVVAQTKGANLAFYRYDDRWSESSSNIFVDEGTLWHATPTGREKLDPALVRDHEARRAAIALLQRDPPSGNAKYLAALRLLGADKALIAECKKLP
ncbi:MAG: hypothetical protein H0T46_20425 [Deltaproteobacteria bacterium]|nr:hypothetical protein [Deltaproteobacteria bacterium]